MFAFDTPRPRRRPSLTPMIDVVFLLLVFFMLAARFGQDMSLPLKTAGPGATEWQGPPRLIQITPDSVTLNGLPTDPAALADALQPLLPAADAPVLLRAAQGTDLGRMVALIDSLRAAGITNLVVVE